MSRSNRKVLPDERQFRLVKFFAYTSFVVLIIFSFPFSMVISQKAKDILMQSYENYALLLGENLNHQVFHNFVLPVTNQFGQIRLRNKKQFEWMDRIVKNTIHSFKIDVVNIYDIKNGIIAYSTDPELIGKKVVEGSGFKMAVKGENSSSLVSTGEDFWPIGMEMLGGEKKLRTYIPFRVANPFTGTKGDIGGVFELTQDLSEEYESLVKLQYLIFLLSIVIMGMIFIALLLIVRKAERTIDERAIERRELEAQLNQAERLAVLGEMIAGVSHEIRNPLGIIRSTAEFLGSKSGSDESQAKLSRLIMEESSRLNDIVTEFLDFARPREPNVEMCRLDEILKKNIQFLESELNMKGISCNENIGDRSLEIRADPHLLYRCFLNVFMNSIQSMEHGGIISINVQEIKSSYIIVIQDTGSGIDEEILDKIFNPFFSSKDKGSGLGLSIVRNIIEGHKGQILIEGNKDGIDGEKEAGTRVVMTLPRNV